MRVLVHFTNEAQTKATITITPSWLGRLLGGRVRRGAAEQSPSGYWVWATTRRDVDQDFVGRPILSAIELREIAPAPTAVVTRRKQ